jgi:hypothetical protein
MNDENKLDIRPVKVGFSDAEKVYVTGGLTASDKLIVTDIAAPVRGMPVRVAGEGGLAAGPNRQPRQKGGS